MIYGIYSSKDLRKFLVETLAFKKIHVDYNIVC